MTKQIPKKTKLYVEQTQREKMQAGEIHRAFQKDLCRLRLTAARAYVGTITDGNQGVSAVGSAASLRLHAQCQGLVRMRGWCGVWGEILGVRLPLNRSFRTNELSLRRRFATSPARIRRHFYFL